MSDTAPVVLVDRSQPGLAVVTLNRPQQMNALSRQLRSELARVVDELEADPEVRVLVLTGAGRAFCAGLDLKELGGGASVSEAVDVGDPVRALNRFTGPVIGAINGVAITGGFELALACDVLLAGESARFADTHARVGILPGWALSQKLSRLLGPSRAKELSLSGNFCGAAQAERWGLVNRVVPDGELLAAAVALAVDMLSVEEAMQKAYKRLIDDGYALPYGEALSLEQERGRERNAQVTSASVEERRAAIQARGRGQQG